MSHQPFFFKRYSIYKGWKKIIFAKSFGIFVRSSEVLFLLLPFVQFKLGDALHVLHATSMHIFSSCKVLTHNMTFPT